MKSEVKKLWTDALRSDDYKQGTGLLTRIEKDGSVTNCCLGVLCDLAVKAGVEMEVRDSTLDHSRFYDGESATLPYEVQAWAGLKGDNNPLIYVPGRGERQVALAELNDGGYDYDEETGEPADPWTFAQIADVIDEQL